MSELLKNLSQYWSKIQGTLFPFLEEELDPLTEKQQQLVAILEVVRIEQFIPDYYGCEGRPRKTRSAIARSFVAKMTYNMPTTRSLWERLRSDKSLRRICGWERTDEIPSESTFSRAVGEFAQTQLPQRVHAELIKKTYGETKTIILHNSRDSTAIEAREKPVLKEKKKDKELKKKRGRPKKEEAKPAAEPNRIEKQLNMSLEEMLEDLPKCCDIGTKKNSKGHSESWIGYKFHLDIADGCIPISAILTSASVHDSQVAIPLATMTANQVVNLYDLMDAAYDSSEIRSHSVSLGHVPLIDKNPRADKDLAVELENEATAQKTINWKSAEKMRYNERSTAERANSRLKDEFGAKMVRVRGNVKIMCHLMFGVLTLTADQLMKFVT